MSTPRGRRLYAPAVLGLLAVGGLTWLALGRTWARATLRPEGLPPDTLEVTGRDAVPLAAALAVVVVAAALAVLATRGRGRLVVGALVVLVGVAGAALSFVSGSAVDDALTAAARQSPAFTGQALPDATRTPWGLASGAGFVATVLLGLVVLRHGRSWPGLSGRYEAPSRRDDEDPWRMLDDGRDPTV